MKLVRKIFLVVAALAGMAVTACEKPVSVSVESVTVEPESLSLAVGGTAVLTVSVFPENAEGTVAFSSDAPEIAEVSQDGTVTAIAVGQAAITATVGGKSAVCTVTVSEEGVEPEPPADALFLFEPQLLDALGANIDVTPAESIEMYYYLTVDESIIDWKYNGLDNLDEELYRNFKTTIDELVTYMEYSVVEAVNSICWRGKATFPVRKMIPDTDYYMIGVGVDPYTGEFLTDVYYETLHTPQGGDLSKFSVEFHLGEIQLNQIKVNTVPSDNMVRYYFNIASADATEEEIIAEVNAMIEEYLYYDMIADANGFYSGWCSVGPDEFTFTNLAPGETSVIYAYGIDNEGQIATDLMFSEEFTNE